MSRSSGTYTAPANSWNPAVEGTPVDETDWNAVLDDLEAALSESVYTGGLGATDNRLVRTDGTDTKKAQGSAVTVDDSGNMSGVGTLASGAITSTGAVVGTSLSASTSGVTTTGTIELGHASDTTIARSGAGSITIEGNVVYRAGGTDVAIADGGTGASTAAAGARALLEGLSSTQGQILYRDGSQWTALGVGSAGQVLQTGGAAANPSWASVAGTGDVTAASSFGTDNVLVRADGTGKGVQASPVLVADTTGALSRSGGGGVPIEGTNTNDSASAGYVGEYISSTIAVGSAVALTNGITANITSISLTAGDWDVEGIVCFEPTGASTETTMVAGAVSTTSATLPTSMVGGYFLLQITFRTGVNLFFPTGARRISLSGTTTVYLVALATFTVSTRSAYGHIGARRVR